MYAPETPHERHDCISACWYESAEALRKTVMQGVALLTLMLFGRYNFCHSSLQYSDITASLGQPGSSKILGGFKSNMPIQEAAKSTSKQCGLQIGRKSKDQHAQSSSGQPGQEYWFTSDYIAQPAPYDTGRKLCKCKCGGNQASINGYLSIIGGDFEGRDHMVNIWEYRHEGDRFAYSAKSYE